MRPRTWLRRTVAAFGAGHGIDHGGRRRNSGQGRHLGDAQLVQGLAEVHLRRRRDAVGALTQEDLVHVQGENLLLGEFGLHQQRNVDLAHLALHVAPRRQEHVARHLHGDGARALADAARRVGHRGAQDALANPRRDAGKSGRPRWPEMPGSASWAAARSGPGCGAARRWRDQLAVPGIDAQRHLQLDVPQCCHVGQGGPQIDISTDVGENGQRNHGPTRTTQMRDMRTR
jgi:hypothetical protein